MAEIYISADIEADGPIPGQNSMLSLGAGAFTITPIRGVRLVDSFSINLQELPDAVSDPRTMAFWLEHQEAWATNRYNPIMPKIAIKNFNGWINSLKGKPVFVAWPATYDFLFVYWYLIKFTGQSPFKWSGMDARSYAMAREKKRWLEISMKDIQKYNDPNIPTNPLPHVAINDALEQGWKICNMIRDNLFGTNN